MVVVVVVVVVEVAARATQGTSVSVFEGPLEHELRPKAARVTAMTPSVARVRDCLKGTLVRAHHLRDCPKDRCTPVLVKTVGKIFVANLGRSETRQICWRASDCTFF